MPCRPMPHRENEINLICNFNKNLHDFVDIYVHVILLKYFLILHYLYTGQTEKIKFSFSQ